MGHGIAYLFAAAGHNVACLSRTPTLRASLPQRLRAIADLLDDDPVSIGRIEAHDTLAPAMRDSGLRLRSGAGEIAAEAANLRGHRVGRRAGYGACQQQFGDPIDRDRPPSDASWRVVGTHFWNPPHLVPLVEVIQNEKTSDDVVRRTMALLRDAGKTPVHVRRDVPGFVGNRLQHAMKREAIALVAAGVCDAETIDIVVREGFGARTAVLGPMEQSDLVGLNLTLDIAEVLYAHLDRMPGPHPFLRDKVKAGKLGMKTGEGLRSWTPAAADAVRERLSRFLADQAKARRKNSASTG